MRYLEKRKRTGSRWGHIGWYFLPVFVLGLGATGCEKELTVAYTNGSEGAIEDIVERQKQREAELQLIASLENAPYITPCAVSAQYQTMPKGTIDVDYSPYFEEDGLYRIDIVENTLSFDNQAGDAEWVQSLPFDASLVYEDSYENLVKLQLKSGIVFGVTVGEEPLLVRYNLNGDLAYEMNLSETFSLSPENSSRISLMAEEPNGNVAVILSTDIPCETYPELCKYQWDPLGEILMASITPEGEIAWQRTYPDKPFIATQLTVRRNGGYMLSGATEMFATNSVIWFLDNLGALEKEFAFLDILLPVDEPYDPILSNTYVHLSAATMEAEDGIIYVTGSCSGDLIAVDGEGNRELFENEPGMGNPFFVFQLNENLGINWSIFDSASDSLRSANVRWGFVSTGWENISLVNNDTIAVIGSVFGKSIINNEDGDGVAIGMDINTATNFWAEYNSQGEFLWVQQFGEQSGEIITLNDFFDNPPDISGSSTPPVDEYVISNLRVTSDNMLKGVAFDSRHYTQMIPDPPAEQELTGFPYPSLAAEVTFCPPEDWIEQNEAEDCGCADSL